MEKPDLWKVVAIMASSLMAIADDLEELKNDGHGYIEKDELGELLNVTEWGYGGKEQFYKETEEKARGDILDSIMNNGPMKIKEIAKLTGLADRMVGEVAPKMVKEGQLERRGKMRNGYVYLLPGTKLKPEDKRVSSTPALDWAFEIVREKGPILQAEICEITGKNRSTISRQMKQLESHGKVKRLPDGKYIVKGKG